MLGGKQSESLRGCEFISAMPNVERNLFRYRLPNGDARKRINSVLHKFTACERQIVVAFVRTNALEKSFGPAEIALIRSRLS